MSTQANPIREHVPGAPYQPGERVAVVAQADDTMNTGRLGQVGIVDYLEYEGGCGQTYPNDPMIGVRFGRMKKVEDVLELEAVK